MLILPNSEIDYTNPLAKGLVFAADYTRNYYDIAGKKSPSLGAGASVSAGALSVTSAATGLVTYGTAPELPSSGEHTVISIMTRPTVAGYLIADRASTTDRQFGVSVDTSGRIQVSPWSNATISTSVIPLGQFGLVGVSADTTTATAQYYLNGNKANNITTGVSKAGARGLLAIGARQDGTSSAAFNAKLIAVWFRRLSDAEHTAIAQNPWQLFKRNRVVYFNAGSSGNLTGDNSNQANTSSAAGIAQTHVTTGAASDQQNTSTSASIITAGALTGANSDQANSSSAAAISQTHVTSGANSSQANASSVAAIIADGTIVLTGANSSQSNASAAASVAQTHVLTGAASQQVNQCTVAGLITGQESELVLPGFLVMSSARQYQTRAARHHAAIAQKRNYKIIV